MLASIGPLAATLWWIAIVVFLLVIVPVVALVAWRLIQVVAEIRRYADDIRTHGAGLAGELEAVAALDETRELTDALKGGLARYADSVGQLVRGGGTP